MTRRDLLLGVLPLAARQAETRGDFANGIFAASPRGPVELIAYAERINNGQLRMSYGSFEDVPAVESLNRLVCNLPSWKPAGVWLSTREIFRDERAERRQLRFAVGQVNVYAIALRVAQVEAPEGVARLLKQVRAAPDNPAYLLLTMTNGSVGREYMLELVTAGLDFERHGSSGQGCPGGRASVRSGSG